MLVQREMERGRSPLVSIAPFLADHFVRPMHYRRAERAAAEVANDFKKEISVAAMNPITNHRKFLYGCRESVY